LPVPFRPFASESDAILLLPVSGALFPGAFLEVAVFQPARGQDSRTDSERDDSENGLGYRKGFLKAIFFAGQVEPTVCIHSNESLQEQNSAE